VEYHLIGEIPIGCRIDSVYFNDLSEFNKIVTIKGSKGIRCEISEGFRFRFNSTQPVIPNNSCEILDPNSGLEISFILWDFFEFAWPSNNLLILDSTIDLDVMIRYSNYFYKGGVNINFVNLKGIDLNILVNDSLLIEYWMIFYINCIDCQFNFYNQKKPERSCFDILESNLIKIQSFFQLSQANQVTTFYLEYCEFKTPLCPLIFKSSYIYFLYISGLANTFYKKRFFEISNETFDSLDSNIQVLNLDKLENIDIDSKILNALVFGSLKENKHPRIC